MGFNYALNDLEIKEIFDIGRYLFNVSLSRDGFFEEWGNK